MTLSGKSTGDAAVILPRPEGFRIPKISPLHVFIAFFLVLACVLVVILPLERSIEIIGNASFAATFFSYAQSSMFRLRLLAIASLVLGLAFLGFVPWRMPHGQGIALVLFWLSVFFVQNIYKAVKEISDSIEAPLGAEERMLLAATFPAMHSRDWQKLSRHASRKTLMKGEVILGAGESTTAIILLARGSANEVRLDGLPSLVRHPGTFFGELTWSLGKDAFNASPCSVLSASDAVHLLVWDYTTLDNLTAKNPRMLAALRDGFIRSAAFKHGLLRERTHDAPVYAGINTPS